MKRWHEDLAKMRHQSHIWDERLKELGESVEKHGKPLGKFRKKHAFDCGKTNCHLCHSYKFRGSKEKTKQEAAGELDEKEQLNERD